MIRAEKSGSYAADLIPIGQRGQAAYFGPFYFKEGRRAVEDSLALYREMLARSTCVDPSLPELESPARRLIAIIAGIGLQACFATKGWTADRMHAVPAAQLSDLNALRVI